MGTGRRLVASKSWRASVDHNGGKNNSPCRPFSTETSLLQPSHRRPS